MLVRVAASGEVRCIHHACESSDLEVKLGSSTMLMRVATSGEVRFIHHACESSDLEVRLGSSTICENSDLG